MTDVEKALDVMRTAIEMQMIAFNETDPGVIAGAVGTALSKAGFAYYYQP